MYDWVWTACGTSPLWRFSHATVPQCTAFTPSFTAEWSQKEIIHLPSCISGIWMNLGQLQLNKLTPLHYREGCGWSPYSILCSLPAFCNPSFVVATTSRGSVFAPSLCHSLGRQPALSVSNTNLLARVDRPTFTEIHVEETTRFLSGSTCLNLLWHFCGHT